MTTCNRCGQCCYFPNEKGVTIKCKYLVKIGGKSSCRIYDKRIGALLYRKGDYIVTCTMREKQGGNYPSCPYNN